VIVLVDVSFGVVDAEVAFEKGDPKRVPNTDESNGMGCWDAKTRFGIDRDIGLSIMCEQRSIYAFLKTYESVEDRASYDPEYSLGSRLSSSLCRSSSSSAR
jgi:hypothetical protein